MTGATAFKDNRVFHRMAECRPGSFVSFDSGEPQTIEGDGTPTWIARGANFVVAISRVGEGSILVQEAVPDESMLLLSPSVGVTISVGESEETIEDEALVIIPPGSARLVAHAPGHVVRIFSSAATGFGERAGNAEAYAHVDDVAPLEYWPEPPGGYRLRVYRLRDHSEDVGFGRIFRSTNLMINVFEPSVGPRDLSRLSPHEHADFEQGSLTLGGDFVHYLRTPWGPDRAQWRADEHQTCSGNTLMVIPPRMIHTTSWSSAGARLVDIFAPPRVDFSLKPGWVRNAADYPTPDRVGGS